MKWKIAHSEASLGWGGQEIRILEEMRVMRQRGHEMILIAQKDSEIIKRARDAGFECHTFSSTRWLYPFSIIKLSHFLKDKMIDVVHTHSSRDGYIVGIAAKLAGVRCLVRARHVEVDYPNKMISRWAFGGLPNHVMTTSEKISKRLVHELDLNPDKVTCVPTGVDLQKYASVSVELRDRLRKAIVDQECDRDTLVIGMIAVLRSWKGHEYFLKAIQILKNQVQDKSVHFLIIGDGGIRDEIEEWIQKLGVEDSVKMLGHRDDIPDVQRALDIVVLPSYAHEGIPQIIIQAQASAKAVVATKVGGIPEVVEDGKTGLLVEPRDEKQLAKALLKLIQDHALRKRLGEKSLEQAKAKYGIDLMCEKTEKIYEEILHL